MAGSDGTVDTISEAELQTLQSIEAAPSGDPALRFIQRCQDWFEDWLGANKCPLDSNAIPATQILMFVFSETPELERSSKFSGLEDTWTRFFVGTHAQDARGLIVSNENMRTAYLLRSSIASMNDAFDLVSNHMKDSDAFVIAQLSQRRMLYHLPGGGISDWIEKPITYVSRLSDEPLSAARIEEDVLEFHKTSLLYAKNMIAKSVWEGKASPYKLQSEPEQRIQGYLVIHLRASYRHLAGVVDEEHVGIGGRCDIRVMWRSLPESPYQPFTTTMLELKVLVEGDGPTHHRNWTIKGINQAHDYRRSDSEAVYACIFDARKDQSNQMLDLDQMAHDKDVRLRRYLMQAPTADDKSSAPASAASGVKKTSGTKAPKKTAKVAKKSAKKAAAKK